MAAVCDLQPISDAFKHFNLLQLPFPFLAGNLHFLNALPIRFMKLQFKEEGRFVRSVCDPIRSKPGLQPARLLLQ